MSREPTSPIARRFDNAAESYDHAASVQMQIARALVEKAAARTAEVPGTILDLGCGTGFVAEAAAQIWPQAEITAVDAASAMLQEARRKVPGLRLIAGDLATLEFAPSFDLILSSMTLHWLEDPALALRRWKKWLKPGGRMHVASLVEGSFREWADLCAAHGAPNSLWPMPRPDFADGLSADTERRMLAAEHDSAAAFLRHLKKIGAATPRANHRPLSATIMRRLLAAAPQPFSASYDVLYIELP